ncbi:MAG: hypothetical protein KDB14_15225 [Planctomycetales bacterium]|nr:hypothetical protein [Planctomycetales bacterium]
MSRWTYSLPRIVLAIILLTIASLGLDPAVRWALTHSVEGSTQGQFRVASVQTDVADGIVTLRHLEVVDSTQTRRLLEAESAVLKCDPWALAKRQLVILDGEVHGVRIDADSEATDCRRDAARPQLASEAASLGLAWKQAVTQDTSSLPSTRGLTMVGQLKQQRLADYREIGARAAEWQARFDELDELTRYVGDNPLRMTPEYRARLEQLSQVGEEIEALNGQLTQLQRQSQQDRLTISEAQQADLAMLQQNMQLAPISGDKLTNYLLEDEWATRIGAWVNWIRQSRELIHLKPTRDRYAWNNSRGIDVVFNAGRVSDFSVRNLYLQGTGQVAGQLFRFRGTLQNLSDEPRAAVEPLVLTLAAEGDGAAHMDVVMDRTGKPVDRVRVVCPALPCQKRTWGDPAEFAIEASESTMRIAMQIEVTENDLNGRIEFAQANASLTPSWPGSRQSAHANQSIQLALQELNAVEGVVAVSGTLDHPVWNLDSDLGNQIVVQMQDVLRTELQQRTELLVRQYRSQADAELQDMVAAVDAQEQQVVGQLAAKSSELEKFLARISNRTDLMDRLVHKGGPLENLLR